MRMIATVQRKRRKIARNADSVWFGRNCEFRRGKMGAQPMGDEFDTGVYTLRRSGGRQGAGRMPALPLRADPRRLVWLALLVQCNEGAIPTTYVCYSVDRRACARRAEWFLRGGGVFAGRSAFVARAAAGAEGRYASEG